jgi:uncharacterized membrane protein
MLSRIILTAAAIVLLATGLALDFLPQETAAALGLPPAAAVTLILQTLAAALLGLGFLNWFSRANPMGGIYSRPLALCDLLLFGVTAVTLVRVVARKALQPMPLILTIAAAVTTVFAAAFIWLMFFHDPIKTPAPTHS